MATIPTIPSDDVVTTTVSRAFAAGALHERGRAIATNTRRRPLERETAVLREGTRLLELRNVGAELAAHLLAGYVEGASA